MAIRIKPDGTKEFDTIDEVVGYEEQKKRTSRRPKPNPDLSQSNPTSSRAAGNGRPSARIRSVVRKVAPPDYERNRGPRLSAEERGERIGRAIRLIASGTSGGGVTPEEIQEELGLSGRRGFSGVVQGIKNRIAEADEAAEFEKLFWRKKGDNGERRWVANVQALRDLKLF